MPGSAGGLVHLVREPAGKPEGALVLLHGRATSEADLYPLLDELDPDRRLLGLTPGGPLTEIPPGGRHWYVIRQIGLPDEATFLSTMGALADFVDEALLERGIPWERTVVGGFSQGCAMALGLALGAGRPPCAGILGISGFLPTVPGWPLDLESKPDTPAYICHGELDPIIPVDFARRARAVLTEGGLDVTYRESPVPHTIDPTLLPEMRSWLRAAVEGS